jgi:hypothetical protein
MRGYVESGAGVLFCSQAIGPLALAFVLLYCICVCNYIPIVIALFCARWVVWMQVRSCAE